MSTGGWKYTCYACGKTGTQYGDHTINLCVPCQQAQARRRKPTTLPPDVATAIIDVWMR